MVRSRKNALVTAIIALILVAAVVLAVVFLGDGAIYTPGGQEATASNAAVTVGSTIGTVDSDYLYTTLVAHSNKKNSEWTSTDMRDLRGVDGKAGTDGVPDTYVTTLYDDFFLITQEGWNSVKDGKPANQGGINEEGVQMGGSGYFEVYYNGVWYRFLNGNVSSGISNTSLYQSYADFMDNTSFYQSSSAYGLMVTDISYDPNSFATNQYFNATLDGNGKTLSATALLNLTTTSYTLAMSYQDLGYNISKDGGGTQRMSGTVFTGMVFGSLKNGTFKNFQWTDADITGSGTHVSKHTPTMQGTAFGGLVGYAGSDTIGGDATSYVNNISLVFNHNVQHISDSHSYSQWNHSRAATYTGGLIGINYSANIELVRVRLNSGIVIEQQTYAVTLPTSWQRPDIAFGCFGGIVGIQKGNRTFSKVIVSGADATAALYGHHCSTEHGDPWVPVYNTTEERMGCVIGAMGSGCRLTLNGVILDINYSECYAWLDKGKNLYRGMIVGEAREGSSAVTYNDIYLTDMVFAGSFSGSAPGPENVGEGGGSFRPITTHYGGNSGGDYSADFWFYGDDGSVRAFAYLDDDIVKDVSFSDDAGKMLQITAPDKNKGVMWNVTYTYTASDGSVVTTLDEDVFTQNSRENVQVSAWTTEKYKDTSKFVRMTIEYASSYTFDVTDGPNRDGSSTKYYDGERVNFPALSLNIPSQDYIMSTGTQYTANGYITISRSGARYQLNFNNGSGAVGAGISNIYNSSGTKFGNDFNSVVSTVLQLEAVQNGEYAVIGLDSWSAQNQANSYRWSSLSLFAMQDSSGNKYVFAPSNVVQAQQAQVDIDQRPIYIKVNQDSKNVPYIGNSYNIASGTSAPAGNVYYTFGTTANDGHGAIIGNDLVSLGSFTLTKDSASVSVAQDAGAYTINVNELLGGSRNNYQLVAAPDSANTFTINPASVTLTVTGGSATYGFTKPANAAEFMEMVEYSFASSNSTLTNFASRDNITVNMNIQTGTTASDVGQWLLAPATGSGTVFAHNFPAGDYTVTYEGLTGTGLNNYTVVTFDNTTPFKVEKAPLVVTLPSISGFTYGEAETPTVGAPSYNGLMGNDSVTGYEVLYYTSQDGTSYETRPFGAGNYYALAKITAISSAGSVSGVNNYDLQPNTQAFDVSKRNTAVQFDYDPDNALIYKGSAHTFNATALTNAAFTDGNNIADTVTFQAYSDVNRQNEAEATNAGTYYPGAVSEILSPNYNITGVLDANGDEWTSFEVLKATITVNAQTQTIEYSGSEVVYDTSNVTIEGEVSGEEELIRNAISILYNGSSAVPVDAGTYSVTVQIDGLANYNAVNVTLNDIFKINPMTVHIVVTKAQDGQISAVYSGINIPAIAYTVQNDEGTEITEATLPVNISYANEEGTPVSSLRNAGTYTVTFTYDGSNGNYAATIATITYTVKPKNLTITVDGVTDGAATQVYNKEVYDPTYTLPGIVSGDVVNPVFTATGGGEIKNAGEYAITVTLDNSNYTLSGNTSYTLTISKFVITPQEGISSLLINADDLSADYYEDFFTAVVYDADGRDVSAKFAGNITFTLNDGKSIAAEGGNYPVTMTVTLPAGFDAINYEVAEGLTFTAHIYRISLGLGFNGIEGSAVTYGDTFSLLAAFTAVGVEGVLTVDNSGKIDVNDIIDDDVTALQVTSASLGLTGTTFEPASVDVDNLSTSIEELFTIGVYDQSNMADAGSYTATISVTVHVTYSNKSTKDITFTMPFAYQVKRKVIGVTLSDVSAYYTDTITEELLMSGLSFTHGNDSFVTVTSAVLNSAPNAATYTYAIQLNEQTGGYYNYALPADSIGKINVQKLTLKVTVNNNSVQYGYAPTQGASATVEVYKGDALVENTAAIEREYSYTITALEYEDNRPVNTYTDALTANVTATHNFTYDVEPGDLTVVPRQLSIVLGAISMSYSDASLPAVTYTLTGNVGLVSGDPLPAIIGNTLKINNEVFSDDINKLDANTYTYTYESVTSDNANYTMTISSGGTLTVNPYQITSVTWVEPTSTLIYKGMAFTSEELYTVEDFTHTNGDVVTFTVNYGGEVKNAGSYTATVAVDNENFSVEHVASKSFSVARANLAVQSIRETAADGGAVTVRGTYNTASQAITKDDIEFTYGEGLTYSEANDGAITVAISHTQGGITADPVNAGDYAVTISVSGAANFNNVTISNVQLVIEKWILTAEEAADNFTVDFDETYTYDSQAHGATLTFKGTLASITAPYTFTYYVQGGDGSLTAAEPENAGTYHISLTVGNDNFEYTTADGANEGSFTINPTDQITLTFTVPTSSGLPTNNVYYTGGAIVPEMSASITVVGAAETVTASDAFTFTFYVACEATANGALDLAYAEGLKDLGLPTGTYYYREVVTSAIRPNSYYILATFNGDGAYSNYEAGFTQLYIVNNVPTAMVITHGAMSVRVVSNLTREYDGTIGFNGRDVIYSTGTGDDIRYWINTDLIQFTGVDLAGMDNLTKDLKVGDITISVYLLYDRGDQDGTIVERKTKLYQWFWDFNETVDLRSAPSRTDYDTAKNGADGSQIEGPRNGVSDFGYANGIQTAEYVIEVQVDNTFEGSYYLPAQQLSYDEDGEPMKDDEGHAIYEPAPHTASGYAYIEPTDIEFEMFYTSDFYNDGADMVAIENGGYKELNNAVDDADGMPIITTAQMSQLSHFLMRGKALPIDDSIDWLASVTRSKYGMEIGGQTYNYETLVQDYVHIVITNSKKQEVYRYENGNITSGLSGITDAGEYTITFTFDGMPGKYEPFTYQGLFIQQKAEYHITVSQSEGANLTTTFGTEFDLKKLENALEVKLEHKEGDFTTNTGHYQAFEDAFNGVSGDIDDFISLVSNGSTSGVASEYPGYKASVGSYFIYYVYISKDSNLEIMMETEESMITVTPAQPDFLAYNGVILDENGATLDDQSYRANYVWNNDILSQLQIGVYYKYANGEKIKGVEPYYSSAVSEKAIEYRENSETGVWGPAGTVSSVGEYRLTIQANTAADGNLSGAVKTVTVQVPILDENDKPALDENNNPQTRPEERTVYVYFTINKIEAAAALTGVDAVDGSDYTGSSFTLGYSVTSGGNSVDSSALGGTVSILVYYGTERPAEGSEFKDIKDLPILNAGTYWVKVVVENSANYTVTPSDLSQIVINKADLNISFSNTAGGYTQTYSEEGFTLPENAFHFELNGSIHTYEDIASNYAVYYLRGAKDSSEVDEFVEAYYNAGSEENIVKWLDEQQTAGNYTGYEFTFVDYKAAATDATDGENYYDYFPVVVYNGNDNFNKYAHLVTNGSYPLITITKALLTLSAGSYVNEGIDKPFAIVYGTELYTNIAQDDATYKIDDYVTLRWTYSNGTTVGADDAALAKAEYSYSLLTMNRYSSSNNNAGTYDDAFELSVNYKHNNYDFAYDPFYVDLIVSPKEITIDLTKATAWLGSNPDDVKNLSADVLFSHTYNGEVYGPLTFALDTAGLGILDKDNTAANTDANGFGTYGIFDVSATNTFANAATAGTFTGNMTITLNNANYTLAGNAAGTISVPVTLNIEKAVLRIDFDLITYKMGETSYADSVAAGTGDHLGWYEYHTIYNGSRFVENDRVYVQSGTWDGTSFTPFGAWSEKTPIGDILSNFSISYGASGNVAAVGEYNIHIALVNPNYKFIDSANNTLGTDASGAQVDLTTQDINVTISPSEAVQIVNRLGGVGGIFTSGTAGEYIRIFDGTSINVNLLKDYLELYAYRKDVTDGSTLEGSLSGNVPVEMVSGTDMLANVINRQATITIKDASGTEVSRIMNAGNYTVTISLNSSTHIMDDVTYNIVITPTDDITSEVSVKSRTERPYNGTDMKPSLSVTITVTDFYLNNHTIAVSDYTVVGYKMVESEGDVLTRPDAPTFTYEVSGGVADYTAMAGLMSDAGTYELVVKFENANIGSAAGEITVGEHFVINPRSLTDSGIASTYTEVFDYTGTALTAEDLGVRVVYNRETDLVMGTDYTITLSDSIYTGHYTFTINGIGNYNDSIGGAYDIGASMGIETAPEAITYGDDSLTITMKVNSLAEGMSAAGLILTFAEGSSARLVSKAANSEATFTVALLSVPSGAINVTGDSITITLTGFGAVPATIEGTDYYLDLSFRCEYNDIAANGAINMNTNAETAKVVVNPADMEEVAQTVSVTTMSVNSTNMSFNISGTPNGYQYSVDNGQTWWPASKGVNLISNLTAGTEFTVQVRVNDTNYETDAGEHTAVVATLTGTTTTGVQEVIDMASSLADNFNASGFDAYVELMQLVASLSSADRANNAAALEAAIAEVEEARAAYIEDLQDAVDNAVHAAELAAGKSTTTSASTVGLAAAGGIALPMLGIGMLFAARRKKNKEDDLND